MPATVQAARRGGGGGGRRPPPPRGPAGAPEPRERRQPPQRSALRRALRHRLRKNQPAQAYRSQPWRRQSRRAQGGRGGGRGACARSGPRGRAAVGVTGKSMRASAAASLGGLSRSECTGTAVGVGWGKEKSRLRAGSADPSGAALQVPAGSAVAAIRAEFRGRAARRGRHATIVAGGWGSANARGESDNQCMADPQVEHEKSRGGGSWGVGLGCAWELGFTCT